MKTLKRYLAFFFAICLLISIVPFCMQVADATAADDQEDELLGQVSRLFETGSVDGNPGRISTVTGDPGGKSYGAYMFASKAGSPKAFYEWCQSQVGNDVYVNFGNELAQAFASDGNSFGSTFDATWTRLAGQNYSGFLLAQSQYIKAAYYTPLVQQIEADVPGFSMSNYSIALRNAFLSRAVQHGVGGAYNVITRAFAALGGFKNQSESELIDAIYAESGAIGETKSNIMTGASAIKYGIEGKTMKYYSGCSGDVQLSVYYRLNIREPAVVHQMLADYGYADASIDQGTYQLLSGANNNLAIVVTDAVRLNATADSSTQQFKLVYYASGYYILTNVETGKRLSVSGSNVIVSDASTSNSQMWTLVPYENGYALQNRETGQYLAAGASAGASITTAEAPTVWQISGGGWNLTGLSCPVNLVENYSNYNFWGTLTSSSAITSVTVEILKSDGSVRSTASATPNSKAYDLHKLDSQVPFSKLSSGSYTLRIRATNSVGSNFEWTQTFYVTNSSQVVLDANGGTISSSTINVALGSVYGSLPTPSRDGYRFDGWFTAAVGGTQVTESTTVPMELTQTLYAHWSQTFTYSFYNYDGSIYYQGQITSGSVIPAPGSNPTKPSSDTSYFAFSGWEGYSSGMTIGSADINFTAQFVEFALSDLAEIQTSSYSISNGYLRAISVGTSAETIRSQLIPSNLISITKNGEEVSGAISTGSTISFIKDGVAIQTLSAVVTGDVNGDSNINITDLVQINFQLLGKTELTDAYAQAADLDGDGSITITDLVQVNFYLLGKGSVTPN